MFVFQKRLSLISFDFSASTCWKYTAEFYSKLIFVNSKKVISDCEFMKIGQKLHDFSEDQRRLRKLLSFNIVFSRNQLEITRKKFMFLRSYKNRNHSIWPFRSTVFHFVELIHSQGGQWRPRPVRWEPFEAAQAVRW